MATGHLSQSPQPSNADCFGSGSVSPAGQTLLIIAAGELCASLTQQVAAVHEMVMPARQKHVTTATQ